MGWIKQGGGVGGSSSQIIFVPVVSPFANVASLNSWAAQFPQNIRNSRGEDGELTVIVVTDNTGMPDTTVNTYQWGGEDKPTDYQVSDWVIYRGLNAAEIKELLESNPNTHTVTDQEKGFVKSAREYGGDNYLLTGTPKVESSSLLIGDVVKLIDNGNFLGVKYTGDNTTVRFPEFATPRTSLSGKVTRFGSTESVSTVAISSPADPIITLASPIDFNFPLSTPNFNVTVWAFLFTRATSTQVSNFRMRVTKNGVVVKYFPSQKSWLDGAGGSVFDTNDFTVDLGDSPLYTQTGETLNISLRFSTGSLKASENVATSPAFSWSRQKGEFITLQDEVIQSQTSTDITAKVNTAYTVDLTTSVTITLPTGSARFNDIIIINSLTNIGANVLTVDAGLGNIITLHKVDGSTDTDQTTTMTKSKPVKYVWNNGWFIYDL